MNKKNLIILVFLVVLSAISVLNYKVYGQDFDKPIMTSATASPSYVDISSGGATVTFSVQVSDTSGVTVSDSDRGGYISDYTNVLNGGQWLSGFSLVSGDQFDGVYQATLFVNPSNVPSDTYSVRIYNSNFTDPGGLQPESSLYTSLQVRNDFQGADFDRPIMTSATASPAYVDISSGGATVTFSVQVSDTSGVTVSDSDRGGYISDYTNVLNGGQWLSGFSLVSGDQFDGVYQATLFVNPSNVPSDTYSVRIYNSNFTDPGGLQPESSLYTSLQVRNDFQEADFDKPIMTSATASPSYVDISSGGATVTFSVQVSDTSGVTVSDSDRGGYISDYTNVLNGGQWLSGFSLVSGDQFDGVYQATLFVNPSNVPSDTYSVRIYNSNFTDPGGLQPESSLYTSLQVRNSYNTVYFENGICKCPGTSVGDTETIDGVTYTVVDNSTIQGQINSGNVNLCTTLVTDMSDLFMNNNSFNSDIGFWDVSNVTNMRRMFYFSTAFNQDIGNWKTSSVSDMSFLFAGAWSFDQDIGNWDVSNVTNMEGLFWQSVETAAFNQDIGNWDTSNVTNMSRMFRFSTAFNQDIGLWNTSNVTDMSQMFEGTQFNQEIGNWDTSNVTDMSSMFNYSTAFNQDLSSWCVSNINTAPASFSRNAPLTIENTPVWGTCPQPLPDYLPSTGLVAWYPFNGNANDLGPNPVNGNVNNAVLTTDRNGNDDNAYQFNGANNYIILPQNNKFNLSVLTISAWVNTSRYDNAVSDQGDTQQVITSNRGYSGWGSGFEFKTGGYNVGQSDQFLRSGVSWTIGSNGGFDSGEIGDFQINEWVHLVYTHTANEAKLYVNGVLKSIVNPGGVLNANSIDTYIGARPQGRHPFTGKIDDVGYWNRALSQAEVIQLFNNEIDTVSPTVTLTHNVSPTTNVSNGDTVTVTATFSEAMQATPTINITGAQATNVAMSPTASSAIWTYNWTVSSTVSTEVSVTVSGTDLAGNTYSGTNSLTFSISSFIYFESGTCKCPNATVGETATISGITYTVVDNSTIQGEVNAGNINLCTTHVTSMHRLFRSKSTFNSNINFWDVSNVTDLSYMFDRATLFDQPLDNWDTSSVVNMSHLFSLTSFNQDISNWDTANVTDMSLLFHATPFNQEVNSWTVSNVINMYGIFAKNPNFNQDISSWDTSNVTNMGWMFKEASAFNQNIGGLTTSNVVTMAEMFDRASSFNQDISNWDTSSVTNMHQMFGFATQFNQNIESWNTSNVTDMGSMFIAAPQFNQPLGNWNVANVTDMSRMFNSATNFNQDIGSWNVSNVNQMYNMFADTNFDQDLSGWCVANFSEEPSNFALQSILSDSNKPIWGSCPGPKLNITIAGFTALGHLSTNHYFLGASTNWNTALSNAKSLTESADAKGQLVIISDAVENQFVSNAINDESVNEAYIGVYQTADGQPWKDVEGNSQTYLPWRSDQPSGSNQNAVMLWHDATSAGFNEQHVWSDENENDNHNYVVEVSHFYLSENTTNTKVRISESSTDSLTFSLSGTDSGLFYLTAAQNDGSGNQYVDIYPNNALSFTTPSDSDTDNEYVVVINATDASNNTSSMTVFLEVRDQTGPTVILTDSDSDNSVVSGGSVVVTATFSEAIQATPTINISGGQASNVAMSATSSSAVWTYNWTVSSTVSTEVSISVSGTDLVGNTYSGTDSLTFNIAVLPNYLPTNGLMVWYPFNGNAVDESGNGVDLQNSGANSGPDRYNQSLSSLILDNLDFLSASDNINSGLRSASDLTISVWIKKQSNNQYNHFVNLDNKFVFAENTTSTGDQGIYFYYNQNDFFTTGVQSSLNQWNHLVVTYNSNSNAKFYLNGSGIGQFDVNQTLPSLSSGDMYIGNFGQALNQEYNTLNGDIDDIGIWNRALSQAEVAQLYNGVIDTVSPTVTLTHNASPTTTVSNGDTVTVTATFSEAMQATPTINISGGQATNAAMSATASSAIWTYNWTVSSTVSTEVSVTVSGTDLAGIAYSGTDSLTFNIAVLPDYLPSNGLFAWYPFNGNANDESGNGRNGTVLNGPQLSTDRNGTADSAYNFDWANVTGYGSDWQRINLDHDFNLGGTFSMNVWINPENHYWPNNNAKSAMILGGSSGCFQNGFRFSINTIDGVDGSIGASDGTSGFVGFDTNNTVSLNTWQMVTIVVEGGANAKMYINGDLISSTTNANFNLSSCLTIGIHHQSNGKWYYFDGKIDDVGIWDRAISQAEVAQLYNGVIDTVSPTVTLTHNASPTVSNGDTVTVTATFSEAMQATPTINISGGQATNIAMSATASSAIWTYNWTVSSTVATELSVTVSGTDLAGIAYSETDSLTFSISMLPDHLPTDGLVAWYPFDQYDNPQTVHDQSGNGNNLTVNGYGLNGGPGNGNTRWSTYTYFLGGQDYLQISNEDLSSQFESMTEEITISSWFHRESSGSGNQTIIARRNFVGNPTGERHHFELTTAENGQIIFSSQNNANPSVNTILYESDLNIFNEDEWNHVVISFNHNDNGSLKLFINGILVEEENFPNQLMYPNQHWLNIGMVRRSGGTSQFNGFVGDLDEIGIWNRALSQGEVAQLYGNQIDTTSPTVTLTHNISPTTTVSNGDTVTVTATFSEAMQASPTVNISGGQATNAAMSATASTAIWTYNWTVSSTVSTEVSVTVSGTDLAGIAYSGTDSLTFNIAVLPDYLPSNGLIAWYPFNGNTNDESGNSLHGNNNGATLTSDKNNLINSAYLFDSGDYIDLGNNPDLNPQTALTISSWINLSDFETHHTIVGRNQSSGQDYGYNMGVLINHNNELTTLRYGIGDSSDGSVVDKNHPQSISQNEWYHFVGTYELGLFKMYLNGELVFFETDNSISLLNQNNYNTYIGKYREITSNQFFRGKIDDVGFWSRALSQAEVAQLYNGVFDTVSPTVTFTHNASPTTTVSNGDTVTVTATFSEAMQATPTINITGGQATNIVVSATASSAVWTYNWTVSSTVSTEVSVTVSGTDLAGNVYSGTDSLTFIIENNIPATATFVSSSNPSVTDQNPYLCNGSGLTTLNFNASSTIAVSMVASSPSWVAAAKVGNDIVVSMNVPVLDLSSQTSYTYTVRLVGSNTNGVVSGTITVVPEDIITFAGSPGDDAQIICVNNTPSPTFAFNPVEYQLSGGATNISSITYRQDGGPVTNGLPPGFGYTINASNTLIIDGIATTAAANLLASTTVYEYVIETGPGACGTDTVSGTIEVRTPPTLTLISSSSTNDQNVCDGVSPIDPIIFELEPGVDNVQFAWTSGASNLLGLTTTLNPARTQFTISGTPAMNVTQTTVYQYQIETVGSDCSPEITLTGSLTLEPQGSITLISAPITADQMVCLFDNDNPSNAIAAPIEPIEYQLGGGAIGNPVSIGYRANGGAYIPGLPAGLGSTITASNTVLITGSIVASTTYVTPTMNYTYEIQTNGGCVTSTIIGAITVLSPPVMNLVSSSTTTNQVVCNGNSIQNIVYEIQGGATNFGFSWTGSNSLIPSGILATSSGTNRLVISGTPSIAVTQTTVFGYEVFTTGNACTSEVILSGSITITTPSDPGTITGSQTIGLGNVPAQLSGTIPSGVSTPSYQWQSGTDSTTFSDIAGATQQNYTPTALTTTTFFRRKVSNIGGCEAFSNVVRVEVDTVGPRIVGVEMTDNTTVTIQFNEPVFANANQSTITTTKFRFTTQTGSITVNSPTPSTIGFIEENKIVLGVDITGSTNVTQTLVINILGLLYDAAGNSLPINEIIQTVQFDLDNDLDGVLNQYDECPDTPFGEQADSFGCANSQRDDDGDGVNNGIDECPDTIEGEAVNQAGCALYQLDEDLDGVLNELDQCPDTPSDETANEEGCSPSQIDTDEDGIPDFLDNCPEVANPEQTDADGDGKGDVCDPDPAIAVIIFELGEDAQPGTYVGEINAVDKDGFPVDVSIDSPAELFVLESTSIILNGELDYETAIEHEIQVFAVSERGSSNTFVTIPVSDVPNATYTGNFFITVFDVQNEQLGSKVDYTRYFNDNDKGVGKWKIKKKITGGNDAGLFRIEEISVATDKIEDENTGILAFINPPDFENPQDHNQDNIYEVEVTYVNTEDGEPEVPIPTTQFNLTVPENAAEAIELQSYPALPTDDTDEDGVPDVVDNSPVNYNPDQTDTDGDGVGDASDDADHDGVWDPYDTCPDTPMGERVDLDGCIQFYLPPTNFSISKTEKCRNTNSIGITAVAQEYTYNVEVSGATTLNDSFAGTTDYTIENLSGGVYTVCLTVEGYDASEYQRCFDVLIEEPQPLSVYASKVADSETVNFSLKGGQVYNITHNGKTIQTDQSNYSVKLDKGNNVINISTGIECQGIFEQTYFNSASIVLAPNPIKEMLYVYVGGDDTDVVISIYASNGVVVHTARYSLDASRTVPLQVGQLQQGSYVVKAQGNSINTSELLIKE